MRRGPLLSSLVASLVAGAATFAPDALAYRPFDGTDADVAETGNFELELGPVHYYAQADRHYLIAPATVLNLGFLPRWELVVDFQNFVGIDTPSGQPRDQLLDTDILTKVVLVPGVLQERGSHPSVALELGPLLPMVNGVESFGASADLIVSQRWSDFTIHSNSWFELTRGDLHLDWFEGVILEGAYERPARPVAELFVEHEFVANLTTWSALIGGIWRASDAVDLDVGLREANVGGDRATEVRLGLTWRLGLWEPSEKAGHARGGTTQVALHR
ncbi:MAG: hypothetical protein ABSE49_14335 [Polyangiaceae bacterium]|jgi:hypothetical protein